MPKQIMDRRAADNPYLHKDFHSALNCGIAYLHEHFGEQAVRDYLRDFTLHWHGPLRQRLVAEGLGALRRHFETICGVEGASVRFEQTADELVVYTDACPAVLHMRSRGDVVSPLFSETTRTVNEALCEDTDYIAELVAYDPQNGRSIQRFRRRLP
jgi:hypothetical protein